MQRKHRREVLSAHSLSSQLLCNPSWSAMVQRSAWQDLEQGMSIGNVLPHTDSIPASKDWGRTPKSKIHPPARTHPSKSGTKAINSPTSAQSCQLRNPSTTKVVPLLASSTLPAHTTSVGYLKALVDPNALDTQKADMERRQ